MVAMRKTLFLFDIITIASNGKPLLKRSSSILPQLSAAILLVVWSANGDCSASSKVNLLKTSHNPCSRMRVLGNKTKHQNPIPCCTALIGKTFYC